MCFLLAWFAFLRKGCCHLHGVRRYRRTGSIKARGGPSADPGFSPKALHFRFESYASTTLPDERLCDCDFAAVAAAGASRRGTEHGADHLGPGNRFGTLTQSLPEGDTHSHSSEPSAGDHCKPAPQPDL